MARDPDQERAGRAAAGAPGPADGAVAEVEPRSEQAVADRVHLLFVCDEYYAYSSRRSGQSGSFMSYFHVCACLVCNVEQQQLVSTVLGHRNVLWTTTYVIRSISGAEQDQPTRQVQQQRRICGWIWYIHVVRTYCCMYSYDERYHVNSLAVISTLSVAISDCCPSSNEPPTDDCRPHLEGRHVCSRDRQRKEGQA